MIIGFRQLKWLKNRGGRDYSDVIFNDQDVPFVVMWDGYNKREKYVRVPPEEDLVIYMNSDKKYYAQWLPSRKEVILNTKS